MCPPESAGPDYVQVSAALAPARTFDAACDLVVEYLSKTAPMGLWAVTRVAQGRQLMLAVDSPGYPLAQGAEFSFDTAFCRTMVSGATPQISTDVRAVPEYAEAASAAARNGLTVGAYVGVPIVRSDGALFGTVCGYSPDPQSDALYALQPQLALLCSLLSAVLEADTAATAAAREAEQSRRDAHTDALTGLLNRRGWDHFLAEEESRHRRFGDPASIIVVDLDELKTINDTDGHNAGDLHLIRTAGVLSTTTREGDVVARLGGDEFGVISIGTSASQAATLVHRIEDALHEAGIAASLGHSPYTVVAGFPGAWTAADQAMYEDKRHRKPGHLLES